MVGPRQGRISSNIEQAICQLPVVLSFSLWSFEVEMATQIEASNQSKRPQHVAISDRQLYSTNVHALYYAPYLPTEVSRVWGVG